MDYFIIVIFPIISGDEIKAELSQAETTIIKHSRPNRIKYGVKKVIYPVPAYYYLRPSSSKINQNLGRFVINSNAATQSSFLKPVAGLSPDTHFINYPEIDLRADSKTRSRNEQGVYIVKKPKNERSTLLQPVEINYDSFGRRKRQGKYK